MGPNERDGEERDRFWNNIVNGYRLCILGDLKGWMDKSQDNWCFWSPRRK